MLMPCATSLLAGLIYLVNDTCADYFSRLIGCLSSCLCLAWFIVGIVWRFKESGSIASGDQLSDADYEKEAKDEDTLY